MRKTYYAERKARMSCGYL